jgi:putative membrane protein
MHTMFWPVFPVFWSLFWVALIALAVTARRKGWWGRRTAPVTQHPTASAEQIIAERYARGEMSDDDYFQKMSVLRGGSV